MYQGEKFATLIAVLQMGACSFGFVCAEGFDSQEQVLCNPFFPSFHPQLNKVCTRLSHSQYVNMKRHFKKEDLDASDEIQNNSEKDEAVNPSARFFYILHKHVEIQVDRVATYWHAHTRPGLSLERTCRTPRR